MVQFQSLNLPQIRLAKARRLVIAVVLQITLLVGFLGSLELIVRANTGYLLWSFPLEQANSYYQLDKLKVWNHTFYEKNKERFRKWPIPIDFFDSNTINPRYLFKPNQAIKREGDLVLPTSPSDPKAFWSSNAFGFRGEDIQVPKQPGVFRIVALGASTTEGSQGNQETYPYFLQQELRKRYPEQNIEVVNAGHHAVTLKDLLEIFRLRIIQLQPDLLIFYEGNNDISWGEFLDFQVKPPCSISFSGPHQYGSCWLSVQYPSWYRWFYNHSALFGLLSHKLGWSHAKPTYVPHQFITTNLKSPISYKTELSTIVSEAKAHHIPVVLSSFISLAHDNLEVTRQENWGIFDALYRLYYPLTAGEIEQIFRIFNQQSASVAQEFNLPYVDLAAEFPKDKKYFPFDIIHLSPEGNELLASLFADFLTQNNLIEVDVVQTST